MGDTLAKLCNLEDCEEKKNDSADYNLVERPAQSSHFSNGQSKEKSIKSCYAVVYELENRKWVPAGEGGWSEVHVCEDCFDNSYRILAWTVKSQQV